MKLVSKLSLYLAKMTLYDVNLAGYLPSERAIGALYVAMRITEQIKKVSLITKDFIAALMKVS